SPDFTVLGGKAVFMGIDASSHFSLWVTDGTVAGTSEVQVAGASSSGLLFDRNPGFTVVGNKALFAGRDAGNDYGLWVTAGTAAGTSELTSNSAYTNGLFYFGVSPDFTPLGNGKAVFEGNDALFHLNLG